jgi:type IV pilus assembly protein PilE
VRNQGGFTLIELMIAVAIVGILAAIELPAYDSSIRRGNRSDAQSFMLDVAQRQQQFYTDRRSYVALPDHAAFEANNLGVPTRLAQFYEFSVAIDPNPPPRFTITATPKGKQTKDGPLTMDSRGVKTPAEKW